jgi:murein DD-endopeptidase MepM/ murein hydrolase activator NlpD
MCRGILSRHTRSRILIRQIGRRLRKRFYILFVARGEDGQLRKIPIPLHYIYLFLAGVGIGLLTLTGIAGSYTRMLVKVAHYNQLRTEKDQIAQRYNHLEQVAQERDVQVASLGSLASEVSSLYGLKADQAIVSPPERMNSIEVGRSMDQLFALRNTALSGAATVGISTLASTGRSVTMADWVRVSALPTLWPIEGRVTGSFGERIDPFNGEGAFHLGVDISGELGESIVAPADGYVTYADQLGGYGRALVLDHGNGVTTRYGHMSGYAVTVGQRVRRGDVIGYVGNSGRSTGPHVHYEVRINDTPVNPYKYLRMTWARRHSSFSAGAGM